MYKLSAHNHGLLHEHEVQIAPWEKVKINWITPWNVKVNGNKVEFNANMH